jgi:hypothetical protein
MARLADCNWNLHHILRCGFSLRSATAVQAIPGVADEHGDQGLKPRRTAALQSLASLRGGSFQPAMPSVSFMGLRYLFQDDRLCSRAAHSCGQREVSDHMAASRGRRAICAGPIEPWHHEPPPAPAPADSPKRHSLARHSGTRSLTHVSGMRRLLPLPLSVRMAALWNSPTLTRLTRSQPHEERSRQPRHLSCYLPLRGSPPRQAWLHCIEESSSDSVTTRRVTVGRLPGRIRERVSRQSPAGGLNTGWDSNRTDGGG